MKIMTLKKQLLSKLTEEQLKELAENKGIKFKLSETQEMYYSKWNEKDKLVDLMEEKGDLTVKEIEKFIKEQSSKKSEKFSNDLL